MPNSFKQIIILFIVGTFIIFLFLAFIFTIIFLYKRKQARLNRDMRILKLDHEKNLLSTQLEIQEQTFRNISQEIHDNISLSLTLAKLHLNSFNMKYRSVETELLESSIDLISKALVDLNDISKSMDSDLIESHGLIHAIEFETDLLRKIGQHQIEFTINGEPTYMESGKELIIFRMVQETCNNILKHADAKNIVICLNYQPLKLEIQISDDGKGFDPTEVSKNKSVRNSAGLKNLHNRASIINGKTHIQSQTGKGTIITFEIPLNKSYESAETN
jgi:two-component system, NarL family, sensor kinase